MPEDKKSPDSKAPAPEPAPTEEQAVEFRDLLHKLAEISGDGNWTQPDQRLRDLVDRVRAALAKAAAK